MSENCSFCDKPMIGIVKNDRLSHWYCRFCHSFWLTDHKTGVMKRILRAPGETDGR